MQSFKDTNFLWGREWFTYCLLVLFVAAKGCKPIALHQEFSVKGADKWAWKDKTYSTFKYLEAVPLSDSCSMSSVQPWVHKKIRWTQTHIRVTCVTTVNSQFWLLEFPVSEHHHRTPTPLAFTCMAYVSLKQSAGSFSTKVKRKLQEITVSTSCPGTTLSYGALLWSLFVLASSKPPSRVGVVHRCCAANSLSAEEAGSLFL